MKRIAVLLILMICTTWILFAKKDVNAWKQEQSLESQYEVFKQNLNFWNGSYFMKPNQMDEFYGAMNDSVAVLEKAYQNSTAEIVTLKKELKRNQTQTGEIQGQLNESIKSQHSIKVFGLQVHKNTYAVILYSIIVGLLALTGIVFMMFKHSNSITVKTKKDYEELKEEYEVHKKNALDRYTQINMELHRTRLELNKK